MRATVCGCVGVCVCARDYREWMSIYWLPVYVYVCMFPRLHMHACGRARVDVCAYVCAGMRTCVRECACV